ncbi:MAG: hypothetical protein IKX01_02635 [Bacteroidales bacterium]|nr:hypothetical protein [Bacteroidales bacterium]
MSPTTWILIGLIVVMTVIGGYFMFSGKKSDNQSNEKVLPLKVQAFERLVLYLERIRYAVLVKRVFMPGMSRTDLQFALIQNVQDEFEHNLAQRLYVSESSWFNVVIVKDEVLKSINAAFSENPDADAPTMAQIIASMDNSLIDKAVIAIKKEFNTI